MKSTYFTPEYRVAFQTLTEGFRHKLVSSAYGSQTCSFCKFVDCRNRTEDFFFSAYILGMRASQIG